MSSLQRCNVLSAVLTSFLIVAGTAEPALAQDDAEQQAAREFNIIAAAYNNGLYDKAVGKWTEFIQKYPQFKRSDEAHLFLGNSQLNLKKFNEAIATYNTLQQKYPQFARLDAARYNLALARFQIATASGKPEDFKAAATACGDLVAKHPTSDYLARSLYYQGESLYSAGDVPGAINAYKQLVQKFPDGNLTADGLYFLGISQQELEKYDEAAATFEIFLVKPAYAQHELAPEIRLRQGICYYEAKKFEQADKRLGEVAGQKESPYADFALLRQGQCRQAAGKALEAADLFAKLPSTFPESQHIAAAQLAAGKGYFDGAKLDDAKRLLGQLIANAKAQPQEAAEGAYYLALTHLKQAQPVEALKVVEPAIQKYGSGELAPFLLSARADALYDTPQRRKESLAVYQEVLQKFSQHELSARALYMSALASLDASDYPAATQLAQRFLTNAAYSEHELRPQLLFISAESQLFSGGQTDAAKRQQAEVVYRQLVEKHPDSDRAPRSLLRIGWCLLESDKSDEAIKYLTGNVASFKLPDEQAEAQLLVGRAHAKLTQHAEALAAFDRARQQAPDWKRGDELLIESAQAMRQLNNLNEAKNRLNQLLAKFADSKFRAEAAYHLGEIARDEKNHPESIKWFTEVVNKYRDSTFKQPAQYALAAVHVQQGEFDKALPALDGLLTAASDDALRARGLLLRGLARQRLNQFAPASADFTAYLATNPPQEDALDARFALALCQQGANNNGAAIATLNQILADKANYPRADRVRYELGHALLNDSKPAEAAKAFEALATAHATSPLAAEAWFHVGQNHEQAAAGQEGTAQAPHFAAAAKAFAAGLAMAKEPGLREKLSYKLGDMQFQQQQYSDAAATLKKQLAEFANGELANPARYLTAESHFLAGQFAESLPLFEQIINSKDPKYLERSLYRAGESAGSVKNWAISQKHYDALIKQFPEFVQLNDARYGLAFAMQNQNQLDLAAQLYEQVAEQSTGESGAKSRFMLGEIAFGKKQFDDAIFHFGAVVSGYAYPHWQGLAQYEMARCFNEANQKAKAISALEKMQTDFADHERAAAAKQLLAELRK